MIDFCFPFLIWIGGQTEFRIGATRSSFVVEMFKPSIHLRIGSAASITPAMISSILHVCIVKQPLRVCSCWQSILGAARQEMNEKQHISSNTTDDFPSCMCLVKCARVCSYVGDDSRTFGPKHDTGCVCAYYYVSFPYTVRLPWAIFSGPSREYKRPRPPKIHAQYQLSYLRLTRFSTQTNLIKMCDDEVAALVVDNGAY